MKTIIKFTIAIVVPLGATIYYPHWDLVSYIIGWMMFAAFVVIDKMNITFE